MSMRFLHIKKAYVDDILLANEVNRDVVSNTLLLEKVYGDSCVHDLCAVTEDGEWLMQGRKIDPTVMLSLYSQVFMYIHSPSVVYDRVNIVCSTHAQMFINIYKATDAILHHAEHLASLVKTQEIKVKIPHQIHLDINSYNNDFISSSDIASKHIRNVFLPVHVVPSLYRMHVPDIHNVKLVNNHKELSSLIDDLRHKNSNITLREYVQGDNICIVSFPHFRNEDLYITMPLVSKNIEGLIHFQEAKLGKKDSAEAYDVVKNISNVLFKKSPVVYSLKVHGKRGVFVESSIPAYFFILHNHDFLFSLAGSHGVSVKDLFEVFIRN